MAVRLSVTTHEVSDLCLGKPALRSLSITDTLADALSAIKRTGNTYISVWNCHHSLNNNKPEKNSKEDENHFCKCIGRVCMVDIICFLCKPQNLSSPATALRSPISLLLPSDNVNINPPLIRHLQPNASLLEAIDSMYEGVQNLVIPIHNERRWRKKDSESRDSGNYHNDNLAYCWLIQEDVIRYLLNSIGVFSTTPASPIDTLGIIDTQNLSVLYYDDPASSALDILSSSISSIAVVDNQRKLIGEISPFMLNSCDETIALAMATLSAGDLLAYVECGGPPEDLVQLVKERLLEKNLSAAVELLGEEATLPSWPSFSSTTSSEEEFCTNSLSGGKNWKLGGYSAKVVRRSEAIVCYPWSSLVAVIIQALAHRVSYVWVVEEDGTLTGIVTFQSILKIFREQLKSMS